MSTARRRPGALVAGLSCVALLLTACGGGSSDGEGDGAAPTPSFLRESDNVVAEGNLRLAGVEAFSPAPSEPGSPTLSRKDLTLSRLRPLTALDAAADFEQRFPAMGAESGDEDGEGVSMRRRPRPASAGEEDA